MNTANTHLKSTQTSTWIWLVTTEYIWVISTTWSKSTRQPALLHHPKSWRKNKHQINSRTIHRRRLPKKGCNTHTECCMVAWLPTDRMASPFQSLSAWLPVWSVAELRNPSWLRSSCFVMGVPLKRIPWISTTWKSSGNQQIQLIHSHIPDLKKNIPSLHPRISRQGNLENLKWNKSANLTQTTQLIDPSSSESKLYCCGLHETLTRYDKILAMNLFIENWVRLSNTHTFVWCLWVSTDLEKHLNFVKLQKKSKFKSSTALLRVFVHSPKPQNLHVDPVEFLQMLKTLPRLWRLCYLCGGLYSTRSLDHH